MPPVPKPAHLRQRRNRTPGAATLPSEESTRDNPVPALPPRELITENWHPKVLDWWNAVWRSPMASEYLESDIRGGLYELAELKQVFWTASDGRARLIAAAEIRLQEVRFGLSPIDRRRLQWEIEKGEKATEQTQKRERSKQLPAQTGQDPRDVLRAV